MTWYDYLQAELGQFAPETLAALASLPAETVERLDDDARMIAVRCARSCASNATPPVDLFTDFPTAAADLATWAAAWKVEAAMAAWDAEAAKAVARAAAWAAARAEIKAMIEAAIIAKAEVWG